MESERGCGYRQWHGVYFVSGKFIAQCDRGLIELEPCSCCGERPRFNRGLTGIKPFKLFGDHENCSDKKNCFVCYPPKNAFLDWVGKTNYTMESFVIEAHQMGISRRYTSDALPVGFQIGRSIIYLAMEKVIEKTIAETIAEPNKRARKIKTDAIFMAYIPQRVEKLFHLSEFTETHNLKAHDPKNLDEIEFCGTCDAIEDIMRKGITPVFIDPSDDKHHKKSKAQRKKKFDISLPESPKEVEESNQKLALKDQKVDSKPKQESITEFFERKAEENIPNYKSLKEEKALKESLKEKQEDQLQQKIIDREFPDDPTLEQMNELMMDIGETTISEQVKMDAMLEDYMSLQNKTNHSKSQPSPSDEQEEKMWECPNCKKWWKYSNGSNCPECIIIEPRPVDQEVVKINSSKPVQELKEYAPKAKEVVEEVKKATSRKRITHKEYCAIFFDSNAKCNCQNQKPPKTVKIDDPIGNFYSQEIDAMGGYDDYDESKLGSE